MNILLPDRRIVMAGLVVPAVVGCSQAAGRSVASLPDDMTQGNKDAKLSVVEYASVGCPVCGHWARDVYPTFKARYVDTGRVKFTYREMLVGGGVELTAAAAGFVLARCAGPSKYFPILEAIYHNQERLFQVPREELLAIARSCGMSEKEFNDCMTNDAAFAALNARVERNSKRDNVDSTPTFVVNGRKMEAGYQPLDAIEAALRKA